MSFEITDIFLNNLTELINSNRDKEISSLFSEVHFADIAEVLEELSFDEAIYIIKLLDSEKTSEILTELDEDIREKILENLSAKEIAEEVEEMDSDDAADIIGELSEERQHRVINALEDDELAADIKELLSYEDSQLIKGFIINKFRGDISLFDDALKVITARTSWKNIGILPFISEVRKLPAEDAVILDSVKPTTPNTIIIAVPMLSRIANFDDMDPLIAEPDVELRFIPPGNIIPANADLVIIPGTKATLADLAFFRKQGWDIDLASHVRRGGKVLGICGGYQMLGKTVSDLDGVEGNIKTADGLGYLSVDTIMMPQKTVCQTTAYSEHLKCETTGYEIHMGDTKGKDTSRPFLSVKGRALGAATSDHNIVGVYLHGLFADDNFRVKYLSDLCCVTINRSKYSLQVEKALDTLAEEMENNLDIDAIVNIARKNS